MTNENNNEDIDRKQEIVDTYLEIVKELNRLPVFVDFLKEGLNRDSIRRYFGNLQTLHTYMRDNYSEQLAEFVSVQDDVFGDRDNIENRFSVDRYFITTAVAEAKVHEGFLDAIDNYCKRNDAQICIMPCESVTNSFEKKTATFDRVFNDPKYIFISDNVNLNENLYLCSIQVSAKQIKPITGLQRIGHREGSYIFASPKQFLEHIAVGNEREKSYAIMTPGACTLPAYFSQVFVSKRLSYIAKHDHTIGGIIVELDEDGAFHFRQVQAAEDGSFIDLGVEYSPNGKIKEVPVNAVMGDVHYGEHEEKVVDEFINLISKMEVNKLILHDVFNGYSINRHVDQKFVEKSIRASNKKNSLREELRECFIFVDKMSAFAKEVYIVKSNHDEFLDRYIESGSYVYDPENHYLTLKIAPAMFEGEDTLLRGFKEATGFKDGVMRDFLSHVTFLSRDDSLQIGGVECGSHGDLGQNGGGSSLNSFEKIYGNCVIGHAHSAAIQRGVFRVGTFTKLDLGYNRGPSSWTWTGALVYENGQRQLLNYINGKFCLGS